MSIYFEVCQTKLQIVQNKLKKGVTSHLSSYHMSRHDFSVFDNLLLYKNRVVIPPTLWK